MFVALLRGRGTKDDGDGALSAQGSIFGSLVMAADSSLEVQVSGNSVAPATVGGAVDLSNGGTVVLVGDARQLKGDHVLVYASSISADVGVWSVSFDGRYSRGATYSVFARNGELVLRVTPPGMAVIFK